MSLQTQVITTSLLGFILILLVENYISRLREGRANDSGHHQVPYQVREQRPRPVNRRQDLGQLRPPQSSHGGIFLSSKPVGVWLVVPKAAQQATNRRCDDEQAEEDWAYTHITPATPPRERFSPSQATPAADWRPGRPLSSRFGPSPAAPTFGPSQAAPTEWRPGKPLSSRLR